MEKISCTVVQIVETAVTIFMEAHKEAKKTLRT